MNLPSSEGESVGRRVGHWPRFGIRLSIAACRATPERRLLAEATLALGLSQLALLFLPIRWLLRLVGRLGNEATDAPGRPVRRQAAHVGWAVAVSAALVPWPARCLARALAAHAMLRRRGIRGTLYLGLRCGASGELDAHAWLRVGGQYVTGQADRAGFTPMASLG